MPVMSNVRSGTPWYASIVTRFTIVFALLSLLAAVVTGWFGWKAAREGLIDQAHGALSHTLDVAAAHVQAFDHALQEDLEQLATSRAVQAWCAVADSGDTAAVRTAVSRMADFIDPFIRSHALHAQMRVIAADSLGMEVIRFDRTDGHVERVPDSLLQAKGDRDYYRVTMDLPAGERAYSAIDLNKEHGVVQRPVMPTLRASAPLFSPKGNREGMVVINADLRPFFASLLALADSSSTLMIANEQGELLLHPDSALTFRFEYGGSFTLIDAIPDLSNSFPHGRSIPSPDTILYAIRPLSIGPSLQPYTLAITRPMSDVLAGLRAERLRLLRVLLPVWLGAVLLALLFAMSVRARLKRLTGRMERYAVGEAVDLPATRRDEIGQMARGLRIMQQRIDERVKELEVARAVAETSDRERKELLANMSHEVRTPLNAIIGMSADIDTTELSTTDQEKLNVVRRSAERLKGLVDDLLLGSRIEQGKLALRSEPFDPRTLIMDIALAHEPAARAKGIALRTDLNGLPDRAQGDSLRLHQVIDNLVGNAVRFTRIGQVDVRASMSGNMLLLKVADTGPGIPESDRERVFQRYERASGDEDNGAGLGLAITSRVVAALGGTLQLESVPSLGSTFTVHIPLLLAPAPAPGLVSEPTARTTGLHVLYVEDVATNRMLMEQWATKWGWDIELAMNGEDAITRCEVERFDVLLIDLGLGEGMNGAELALRLRGTKRHRYTPMIAVTAYAAASDVADALKAGMNDHVTKPIDKDNLLRTVAFWSDREGMDQEPDIEALAKQYDQDPEALLRVYQQYRKEFTQRRLALRAALERQDAQQLADTRHALRPHWQLLKLDQAIAALDALGIGNIRVLPPELEETFRICDRAFLRAQRALITTT